MKTIILYYSWSGKTKALAVKKAGEINAGIEEVTDVKKPSIFGAFIPGAYNAMKRKKTKINPVAADLTSYEKIIIMAPVWASHPAPAFNNIAYLIPSGKKVEIVMVSGGGGTKKTSNSTTELFTSRGCEVTDYIDIKA
ncbi:MAG: hypothetical protein FWB83_09365 [Treponema sp.]|nr:hypothetical protein [Treponema sp.]